MEISGSRLFALACAMAFVLGSILPAIEVPLDPSMDFARGPATNGPSDEWHFFHKNLKNTGEATSNGPLSDSTIWVKDFGRGSSGSISYADGVLFRPAGRDGVQAINASTGSILWTRSVGPDDRVHTTPAYYEGVIYFGTMWGDRTFYAVDVSNGSILWTRILPKDEYTASPLVVDGVVYAPLASDRIVAMDALNGSVIWDRTTNSYMHTTPAYEAGVLYIGHYVVHAISAETGYRIWDNGVVMTASGMVIVDNKVCGHYHGHVFCLDKASGSEVWVTNVGPHNSWNAIESTPAVLGNMLFVGTQGGLAYGLNLSDGSVVWSVTIGEYRRNSVLASPITAPNDVVYFANRHL